MHEEILKRELRLASQAWRFQRVDNADACKGGQAAKRRDKHQGDRCCLPFFSRASGFLKLVM
jgi:hypothetical protein